MKLKINKILGLIIFSIFFIVISTYEVNAGPLKDLDDSLGYSSGYGRFGDEMDKRWFKDNPNLEMIFLGDNGKKAIGNYLGESDKDFFLKERYYKSKNKLIKDETMAFYRATYQDKNREWLSIAVYIPHPKYKSNVELGLDDVISKFSTPYLKVYLEKIVDLNGIPGTLYAHKDNACSIVVKLPCEGRLRAYKKKCDKIEELEKFTKGFDIKRLINKITPVSEFKK